MKKIIKDAKYDSYIEDIIKNHDDLMIYWTKDKKQAKVFDEMTILNCALGLVSDNDDIVVEDVD